MVIVMVEVLLMLVYMTTMVLLLCSLLTSLVFHRWRWVGKWSDFGNDSRDSGSLIGSPSKEETV